MRYKFRLRTPGHTAQTSSTYINNSHKSTAKQQRRKNAILFLFVYILVRVRYAVNVQRSLYSLYPFASTLPFAVQFTYVGVSFHCFSVHSAWNVSSVCVWLCICEYKYIAWLHSIPRVWNFLTRAQTNGTGPETKAVLFVLLGVVAFSFIQYTSIWPLWCCGGESCNSNDLNDADDGVRYTVYMVHICIVYQTLEILHRGDFGHLWFRIKWWWFCWTRTGNAGYCAALERVVYSWAWKDSNDDDGMPAMMIHDKQKYT